MYSLCAGDIDPMESDLTGLVAAQGRNIERDTVRRNHLPVVVLVVVAIVNQIEIEFLGIGIGAVEIELVFLVVERLVVQMQIEVRLADMHRSHDYGRALLLGLSADDYLLAG